MLGNARPGAVAFRSPAGLVTTTQLLDCCSSGRILERQSPLLHPRLLGFSVYADSASADVAASLLTAEGVPTSILSDEPMPGLINGFRLMVPSDLVHRAKWIVSNDSFTDEESASRRSASRAQTCRPRQWHRQPR